MSPQSISSSRKTKNNINQSHYGRIFLSDLILEFNLQLATHSSLCMHQCFTKKPCNLYLKKINNSIHLLLLVCQFSKEVPLYDSSLRARISCRFYQLEAKGSKLQSIYQVQGQETDLHPDRHLQFHISQAIVDSRSSRNASQRFRSSSSCHLVENHQNKYK